MEHRADLTRFKIAQERPYDGFDAALAELRAGRKRSHWIWYIFPQLAGLGSSSMSVRYGLQGLDEARAYLRDPVLRERLHAVLSVLAASLVRDPAPALADVMGSDVDARKVVSSMTLFREIARRLGASAPDSGYTQIEADAAIVLRAAVAQGIPECQFTRTQVAADTAGR